MLFRLTESHHTKAESGFTKKIIERNNRQNEIKKSDYRSNDPIQTFLKQQLSELTPNAVIDKNIQYKPKRGENSKNNKLVIDLERLAKIRYSFLFEPTVASSDPHSLWDAEGLYPLAFGVDQKLYSEWSRDIVEEVLLAIALWRRVDTTLSKYKRGDDSFYLRRCQYHILALAGVFLRTRECNVRKLLKSETEFSEFWKAFYPHAKDAVAQSYISAQEQIQQGARVTFNFVRNEQAWASIQKRFKSKIEDID